MDEPRHVFTSDGRQGVIVADHSSVSGERPFVQVRMEDGKVLHVPSELLELRPDGAFNLRIGMADIETLTASSASAAEAGAGSHAQRTVLPVVVEELEVGRRKVITGVVRVTRQVHERDELVDEPVVREDVRVERVPVDRLVDAPPALRSEGDTLIIPVLEEVLVVEKRLRVKEEVRVTWQRTAEPAQQRVTLRNEEVVVERLAPDQALADDRERGA